MKLHVRLMVGVTSLALTGLWGCSNDATLADSQLTAPTQEDGRIVAAPQGASKVPDHYVVVLKADADVDGVVRRLNRSHGVSADLTYTHSIRGFSASIPPGLVKKILDDESVVRLEEDFVISVNPVEADARPPKGGGGTARITPERTPWGVVAVAGGRDATGKVAWIIDSGIDPNHPDLKVDASRSKNFVSGRKSTWVDGNGHGTHVAGTVGAKADGYDVVGVAPNATLVAVRVLDNQGSGQYSWVIGGVDWVAANGNAGDVANMSLTGPGYAALDAAVASASSNGITFVLAAGNDGKDVITVSPARQNGPYILTVSAHDINNNWAYFSNFGAPVDWAAPGVNVESTKRGGGVTTMSGTSMAAPHVAGIVLVGELVNRGYVNGDRDSWTDPLAKLAP